LSEKDRERQRLRETDRESDWKRESEKKEKEEEKKYSCKSEELSPRLIVIKLFVSFTLWSNKLECFLMPNISKISQLVYNCGETYNS
jgi:hypothetical protein